MTTTERGLGWTHQQLRARLLPDAYGKPCPRCNLPMLHGQDLDLGHALDRATHGPHNPGPRRIEHARCNRQAGQALGMSRRRRHTPRRVNSRTW